VPRTNTTIFPFSPSISFSVCHCPLTHGRAESLSESVSDWSDCECAHPLSLVTVSVPDTGDSDWVSVTRISNSSSEWVGLSHWLAARTQVQAQVTQVFLEIATSQIIPVFMPLVTHLSPTCHPQSLTLTAVTSQPCHSVNKQFSWVAHHKGSSWA